MVGQVWHPKKGGDRGFEQLLWVIDIWKFEIQLKHSFKYIKNRNRDNVREPSCSYRGKGAEGKEDGKKEKIQEGVWSQNQCRESTEIPNSWSSAGLACWTPAQIMRITLLLQTESTVLFVVGQWGNQVCVASRNSRFRHFRKWRGFGSYQGKSFSFTNEKTKTKNGDMFWYHKFTKANLLSSSISSSSSSLCCYWPMLVIIKRQHIASGSRSFYQTDPGDKPTVPLLLV